LKSLELSTVAPGNEHTVTDERWEELVRRQERAARERPGAYRRRVGLLAALGYGYILLVLAAILAIGVAIVVLVALGSAAILVKLAIPFFVLAGVIVRSLWVRLPPPGGIRLKRADAPALFDAIEEVRKEVGGPRVHRVLAVPDLNAAVVQIPRMGPIGPARNYLLLGLPLLQALPADCVRAVLAHEFGHLSGRHGRFGAWIYRLRGSWARLLNDLEARQHAATGLFRRFFEWYAPYFSAYSFALARGQEYFADEVSAKAAGERTAARALVELAVADRFLDAEYWPRVFERARAEPAPPANAFAGLATDLPLPERDDLEGWVGAAVRAPGGLTDTHPSLADRLRALGTDPEEAAALVRERPSETAADVWLGPFQDALAGRFDDEWRDATAADWKAAHDEMAAEQRQLEELRRRDAGEPLQGDDVLALARLTMRYDGDDAAVPVYERVLASESGSHAAVAHLALGRIDIERDRLEPGLAHLDRAMEGGPAVAPQAAGLAYGTLMERGDEERAAEYRRRGEAAYEKLAAAEAEASSLGPEDRLEPHGLEPGIVHQAAQAAGRHKGVKKAYLARKAIAEPMPGIPPLFVMAVDSRNQETLRAILHELRLPGAVVVLSTHHKDNKHAVRQLASLEGAQVYRR
jgi:Zn-dependent protease with chaperone function